MIKDTMLPVYENSSQLECFCKSIHLFLMFFDGLSCSITVTPVPEHFLLQMVIIQFFQ